MNIIPSTTESPIIPFSPRLYSPAIAGEFSRGLKGMMGFSVVLGIIFTTAGLYLSYLFDLPSGATIILVAAAGYILALLMKK